jgi:hypothetical protein
MENSTDLKQRIDELEGQLTSLTELVNYFLKPLLLKTVNEGRRDSSVPPVMRWLRSEFNRDSDQKRLVFLSNIYEALKNEIPMRGDDVGELPLESIKEEEIDPSIFER